ncbi:MAG TPA: SDR family NAD(P)-dependent oxidoreductase [Dehalococcoidia bacterium]|nr:SDR family NAD(P)-dependent oxidoreductase [Dehalococcoidia bacterium]
MSQRLEGKVALVTGAAGYLGQSHCVHLAREGAKVVVTDILDGSETVAAVEKENGEAIFLPLDVTDWEQAHAVVAETVKAFGRLDILVNNAALTGGIIKPWTEFTPPGVGQKLGGRP